jgi:hypothetical protein
VSLSGLFVKVEALESRCMALENILGTPYTAPQGHAQVPAISIDPSNQISHLSSSLHNNFNAEQDPNFNDFQWLYRATSTAHNAQCQPGILQFEQFAPSHHVASSDQVTTDEELRAWFDSNLPTFQITQSYDADVISPVVPGNSGPLVSDNNTSSPVDVSNSDPGATTSMITTPGAVHHCQQCMKSFSRATDLRRHARTQHDPRAPRYFCPSAGCDRHVRPFLRMDKLREHRARKNH